MSAEDPDLLDYEDEEQETVQEPKANGEALAKKGIKGAYVTIHSSGFRDFILKPELLRAIVDCGFEHPSEVQHECIPQAILSMDVLCQAKSGMGKTAVFVIATLQQLDAEESVTRVLVGVFFGGVPIRKDIETLTKSTIHIVVGTPGRILDLVRNKALKLAGIKHFILDECDKMLETLGLFILFYNDVRYAPRRPRDIQNDSPSKTSDDVQCYNEQRDPPSLPKLHARRRLLTSAAVDFLITMQRCDGHSSSCPSRYACLFGRDNPILDVRRICTENCLLRSQITHSETKPPYLRYWRLDSSRLSRCGEGGQRIGSNRVLGSRVSKLIWRHQPLNFFQPLEIFIDNDSKLTLHGLRQHYVKVKETEKNKKLFELLDELHFNQVIIFVKSVQRCTALAQLLVDQNFPAIAMHRAMNQEERLERYQAFKNFQKRLLVATNLFGRGMDIERVNIVFNYDMPEDSDTYLHRVARAGRFGTKGLAITFISDETDAKVLNDVQNRFEVNISELPDVMEISSYMEDR
ncbi:unnamed protein product [Protopolystoma xenopodis]|uniref:RNA helicase n=1 Tax=Protopolystoma xenopodis TaxID=117903 RepID=A0A3S5FC59_9PLAT|nr:unnamed protein product [Protopolystoma xenopodis]